MDTIRTRLHILLHKIQKILKIDMFYLARGTFWSTTAQIVSMTTVVVSSIIVGRYLPKEIYGEYKFILSLVSTLSIFSLSGLGSAVLQSVSRGFDGSLAEGFKTNLRWSLGIFLGALALAVYYFLQHNNTIAIGVLIGGSLSPFITSASLVNPFLSAKADFARGAIYGGILGSAGPTAALIIAILLGANSLILVIVYFISNLITDLYVYCYIMRIYQPNPNKRDPEIMTYAKHLSFLGILGGIAGNLDNLLLFHFVGPAQLAMYSFATGIPDQLKGPIKNLDLMLQVRFANYLPKDIRSNMRTKSILLFLFSLVCVAIYIPLAPFFYHILYPTYSDAIPYSQIYMLSFLTVLFAPSGSYLSAKKLVREQYISNISVYIIQIVSMTIGVIGWGLWGLIYSIMITRLITGIIWYTLFRIASKRDADKI